MCAWLVVKILALLGQKSSGMTHKKLLGILRLILTTGRTKVHVCINNVVTTDAFSPEFIIQLPRPLLQDSGNSFIHRRVT